MIAAAPAATVLHETPPRPGHRCCARILATCSECEQPFIYCQITDEAIDLLLERLWLCSGCLLRCAPLRAEAAADLPVARPAWVTATICRVWADMALEGVR